MATLEDQSIFKQWVTGLYAFTHQPFHRTLRTSLYNLPNTPYPVSMNFNDGTNQDIYPSSSTHRGSNRRPWLEVVLVNGEAGPSTPADRRGLGRSPGHMAVSPSDLPAEASLGKYSHGP